MPVDGDVLQEFAGGAVLQDDALRGNLEGDLRSFLAASFRLSRKTQRAAAGQFSISALGFGGSVVGVSRCERCA